MPFNSESEKSNPYLHEYTEGGAAALVPKPRIAPFEDQGSLPAKEWLRGYDDTLSRRHEIPGGKLKT